jgi:hypothetical protein
VRLKGGLLSHSFSPFAPLSCHSLDGQNAMRGPRELAAGTIAQGLPTVRQWPYRIAFSFIVFGLADGLLLLC